MYIHNHNYYNFEYTTFIINNINFRILKTTGYSNIKILIEKLIGYNNLNVFKITGSSMYYVDKGVRVGATSEARALPQGQLKNLLI